MLKKIGTSWQFVDESNLERFLWEHLEILFKVKPIARQYLIGGLYCDIIGVSLERQLFIFELKNEEPRHIVQQLTQYFHQFRQNQPLLENVDFSLPIKLIAIAPSFHAINFIDHRYSILDIDFFQFSIKEIEDQVEVIFKGSKRFESRLTVLPHLLDRENVSPVEPPSQALINWIGSYSADCQKIILNFREKVLSADEKMREDKTSNCFVYGRGKSKLCMGLKKGKQNSLELFLWLPVPEIYSRNGRKNSVGRMYVRTNWEKVDGIYYLPKGNRSIKTIWTFENYIHAASIHEDPFSLSTYINLAINLCLQR